MRHTIVILFWSGKLSVAAVLTLRYKQDIACTTLGTSNVAGSVKTFGDRELLFQAAANLLDNAINYTPANGAIELPLREEA